MPAAEAARDRTFVTREESSLPPQVPKVMGNLLKAYAGMHFSYDARGNLVKKQSPSGQQRYEWDAFNRLQAVSVQEASRRCEARYVYDALGRRIAKEVNGERTVFGWDGDTLAYESDEHGSTHYVCEPGSFGPLAQYVTAPVAGMVTPVRKENDRYAPEDDPLQRWPERVGDAHVFYYHCNQIGTPLLMTDDTSEVVWEASYKAWGETQKVIERASQAAGITPRNRIRFQGQQVDEESGLHYNRHRYYDPAMGRFISMDPIGLRGGLNSHIYPPNPVLWVDPLGLARAKGITPNNKGTRTTVEGGELDTPVVGYSAKAGGDGIQHPVVQELYDSVSENQRSLTHGYCGEADALSQVAQHNNVQSAEELRKIVNGGKSTTVRNDGKHLAYCRSCAHVMVQLNVCDGVKE